MATGREKPKRPKYDIKTIDAGGSKEAAQVERVMNFLAAGSEGAASAARAGGEQYVGPPPTGRIAEDEVQPTERVSLDHVFQSRERRPARPQDAGDDDAAPSAADGAAVRVDATAAPTRADNVEDRASASTTVSTSLGETHAGEVSSEDNRPQVSPNVSLNTAPPAEPFEVFAGQICKLMRSTQRAICKVIYENTIGSGRAQYDTTIQELADQLGILPRAVFRQVSKLEEMEFISRTPLLEGKRSLGVSLRLNIEMFN